VNLKTLCLPAKLFASLPEQPRSPRADPASKRLTATIYATETPTQLIAEHMLRADINGDVEILGTFWKAPVPTLDDVVHPLLAYADLTATTDGRNLEAARMIYDRYIEPAFRNPA